MQAVAKILRARASEHSSNFCEQFEQRPNFASTFKLNGPFDTPPIVSSNSHLTERMSHFVDYHLQPLVHELPSFVKDTKDFLNKRFTIGNLPANILLVTLDVSSLYTNIPHNEGINACEHFLRTSSHNTIPTGTLCHLIRMILTMNNFSFNDNHYLQIHGTAMGTKMAPSYANLFLSYFDANALENASFQLHTWLRYIDDIFMIWYEGLDNLKIFHRLS